MSWLLLSGIAYCFTQDSDSEEEEEEEEWSGSELERYTNALIDIPAGRFFCDSGNFSDNFTR